MLTGKNEVSCVVKVSAYSVPTTNSVTILGKRIQGYESYPFTCVFTDNPVANIPSMRTSRSIDFKQNPVGVLNLYLAYTPEPSPPCPS